MELIWNYIDLIFGIDNPELTPWQMGARGIVVYFWALFLIRLGDKRFIGKNTAFDVILAIIIGSVVSRAINGSAGLFATMLASFVLIGAHWLLGIFTYKYKWISTFVKGNCRKIVSDGELIRGELDKSHLSNNDVYEQLRLKSNENQIDNIEEAVLERNGEVSIVRKKKEPRVIEFPVEEGTKRVRIEME